MLQPIIGRSPRRTKRRFALATPVSSSPPRTSLVESVQSNSPLLAAFTTWTFDVGTTWILHGYPDTKPISPKNQSKALIPRHFQPDLSHLMAEAPILLATNDFQCEPSQLIAEAPYFSPGQLNLIGFIPLLQPDGAIFAITDLKKLESETPYFQANTYDLNFSTLRAWDSDLQRKQKRKCLESHTNLLID